jgi:N-acetylglucosamine-6-phosphate deacetylase
MPNCDFAIHASQLFDGDHIRKNASVLVKNGAILDVVSGKAQNAITLKEDALLAPGFIDCQVNGGDGVMFNDDPSPETIATIADAHRRFGVTSFLPTFISDTREKMRMAIAAVDEVISQGQLSVLGIHLEGPFLNPKRRGAHAQEHIAGARADDIDLLSSLKKGTTLVTLAPEVMPEGFISALKQRGIIICAGHTDARSEEIETALQQGVRGFTHLYNAMSQMTSRAPGAVGACLADSESFAGIIADGHHVSAEALRVALKSKTARKLFLVSDAMASFGTELKSFSLFGEKIYVERGRLSTASGTLAGAQLDIASAMRFMIKHAGATLNEALTMTSSTPATFLRLENKIGRIAPGLRADFIVLDASLSVSEYWVAGQNFSAQSLALNMRA